MRTIGIITVARSDYGIYRPLLRRIQQETDLRLHLMVSGAHLLPQFGHTVEAIEADGFPIAERVDAELSMDTPEGIARSMGAVTCGFGRAFARFRPDLLVALGDRFEMHAAVAAAQPFLIPVAHIAGGCVTVGAIDDAFRYSMTKMSHLHFAETQLYARRIIQTGEEPWRVTVSGALGLDNLRQMTLLSPEEFQNAHGARLEPSPLLVTFHPVTREPEQTEACMTDLLAALEQADLPVLFTYPGADAGGRTIIRMIESFAASRPGVYAVPSLDTRGYFSAMQHARAMVGNSSSGIVEAPSFKLPVVNIGSRQEGRLMAANVINVGYGRAEILRGIRKAASDDFRRSLRDLANPYGDGAAAERIVSVLKRTPLDEKLLKKRFHELA